ncbi:hypothetical protein HDU86_003105 [Geranomyces michiganensis]|nr:hypothetical protein HDU86_003105 [Geranomyces michiganensis]
MAPFLTNAHACPQTHYAKTPGSKSIGIHEKNCIEKWDKANAALPRDQRRARPKPPLGDAKIGGGAGMSAQEYNDAAFQTFMKEGREECPNCGRGFLKDRLEIHLRSCRPGGHFAKEREKRLAKQAGGEDPTGTQHTAEHLAAIPNRIKPIESLGGGKVQLIANRSPKAKTRPTTAVASSSPVLAKASEQPSRFAAAEQARPAAVVGVARATTPISVEGGGTLAKFCADCGYSFASEKFCPSCGLKRTVI